MDVIIRMKTVARVLIFAASLVVWLILLSIVQYQTRFVVFGLEEGAAILGAVLIGSLQTAGIAYALKT